MKRILIVSHNMDIGGVERSLLGLLETIDYKKCSVDLFLFRHTGAFMELIPEAVNLLPQDDKYASIAIPMKEVIKRRHVVLAAGRFLGKLKARRYLRKHAVHGSSNVSVQYSHRYTYKHLPPIGNGVYDLAISFSDVHYAAAFRAAAKKKIAWIHTDYSFVHIDKKSEQQIWEKYDHIAAVSEDCMKSFLQVFPQFSGKLLVIENILPERFVKTMAYQFTVEDEMPAEGIRLLSVGRFCQAKNFDNIPQICSILRKNGYNVTWYLIGYGADEQLIEKNIAACAMDAYVKILGKKENPYPYINACDIYVQPSRYEGKAVTVREAQMLAKPVVITDFSTAKSQLTDGFDGLIAPLDNALCAQKIAQAISDETLKRKLISNCKNTDYSNAAEIEKIYGLLQ